MNVNVFNLDGLKVTIGPRDSLTLESSCGELVRFIKNGREILNKVNSKVDKRGYLMNILMFGESRK